MKHSNLIMSGRTSGFPHILQSYRATRLSTCFVVDNQDAPSYTRQQLTYQLAGICILEQRASILIHVRASIYTHVRTSIFPHVRTSIFPHVRASVFTYVQLCFVVAVVEPRSNQPSAPQSCLCKYERETRAALTSRGLPSSYNKGVMGEAYTYV